MNQPLPSDRLLACTENALRLVDQALAPRPSVNSRRAAARADIADRAFKDCEREISADLREHLALYTEEMLSVFSEEVAQMSRLKRTAGSTFDAFQVRTMFVRALCHSYSTDGFTDDEIDHWMSFQPKPIAEDAEDLG